MLGGIVYVLSMALGIVLVILILMYGMLVVAENHEDFDVNRYKKEENKNKKNKKYKEDLGKDYWEMLQELEQYFTKEFYEPTGRMRTNVYTVSRVINLYKENPEDYSLYMHKYRYAFTLTKTMIDEAIEMGVLDDMEFIEQITRLIEEYARDFGQQKKALKIKDDEQKKISVQALNKQIQEEINMLKGIRELRNR